MPHINRKGLTEVITLVMIILISISAATIFFAAIINTTTQLSPSLSCGEHKISQTVKIEKACFTDGESREIKLMLRRNFNTQLNNVKFSATDGSLNEEWICGQSCGDCSTPSEGETRTYSLLLNQITPTSLTVAVDNCILKKVKLESC